MTTTEIDDGASPLRRARVIGVDRHRQGPRVYLFGRRIHEYMLGASILALVVAGWLSGFAHDSAATLTLAGIGLWLVAKDWRDILPSQRDTASWRLGIHRRATPLREARSRESVPFLAAVLALAVAFVNLISALTADVPSRVRLLLHVEPLAVLPISHAVALPAAAALGIVALSLARRRRRALHLSIALLVALAAVNLLKGLDVEAAALSLGLAGLLWWSRSAFYVGSEPFRRSSRVRQAALGLIALGSVAVASTWAAVPRGTSMPAVVQETLALLTWSSGPLALREDLGWLPIGLGLMSLVAIFGAASILFRRHPVDHDSTGHHSRRAALSLIRAHGRDTLAFFKLRRDADLFFSRDGKALLGYRVTKGVLLLSGDPIGPAESLPALLRELCSYAERSGLAIGAIGVSADLLPLYRTAGLHSLYLGDEAIVDTEGFSLEGRAIRKLRQSVHRLDAAGFTAALHDVDELDGAALVELESVSARWRGDAPERGFSMAMDGLVGADQQGTVVVVTRDPGGVIRGFLHFVPTFGRPAMSLSLMRRDRETPNGLTEFLVVRAIELLRERGIAEVSLNFAAFARVFSNPSGRWERSFAYLLRLANPFFQIESLYRFNAKFRPHWEPRYLLYERMIGLPRTGIAALAAEGLLPRLVAPTAVRSALGRGSTTNAG